MTTQTKKNTTASTSALSKLVWAGMHGEGLGASSAVLGFNIVLCLTLASLVIPFAGPVASLYTLPFVTLLVLGGEYLASRRKAVEEQESEPSSTLTWLRSLDYSPVSATVGGLTIYALLAFLFRSHPIVRSPFFTVTTILIVDFVLQFLLRTDAQISEYRTYKTIETLKRVTDKLIVELDAEKKEALARQMADLLKEIKEDGVVESSEQMPHTRHVD